MKNAVFGMLAIGLLMLGCTTPGTPGGNQTGNLSGNVTGQLREFNITASEFQFTPGIITVNKGDTVRITLTSADEEHGFALPDFGVSQAVEPGKSVTVEFVADKTGTFTFFCNIPCGPGHSDMKGTLIVQ